MRDTASVIKCLPSTNPAAAITGNGTTTGATIDTAGYEGLTFVYQSGTITDGTFTGHVYAGNAANMSDEAEITGANLVDSAGAPVFALAADSNKVKRIGVAGGALDQYRYFRFKAVQSGATSGGTLNGTAILSNPRFGAVAAP